jgi:hypothetical protein
VKRHVAVRQLQALLGRKGDRADAITSVLAKAPGSGWSTGNRRTSWAWSSTRPPPRSLERDDRYQLHCVVAEPASVPRLGHRLGTAIGIGSSRRQGVAADCRLPGERPASPCPSVLAGPASSSLIRAARQPGTHRVMAKTARYWRGGRQCWRGQRSGAARRAGRGDHHRRVGVASGRAACSGTGSLKDWHRANRPGDRLVSFQGDRASRGASPCGQVDVTAPPAAGCGGALECASPGLWRRGC